MNIGLIDLIDKSYVVDNCIAFLRNKRREEAYEYYITDVLMNLTNNVGQTLGGSVIKTRFYDVLHPPKKETRTGREIIDQMKGKLAALGKEVEHGDDSRRADIQNRS